MPTATRKPLRLGVIGLGRAFTLMLPTFMAHPGIRLVAATDPRPEARARFVSDFDAAAYEKAEGLCADAAVQAVYVASPHQVHVEHVCLAAAAGKHVLVEKPMALTLADADLMIAAARTAGVHLLVGHSHSFDEPYRRTRALIETGAYGRVRMITALNYTDFLYRPRRPEELDTRLGGGVVFSQAAHQVDVVRLLADSPARSVRAQTGAWDAARPTEGAHAAQIGFENGAFASLTYSGYGRFDTDEFHGWIGKLGESRDSDRYGSARASLRSASTPEAEIGLKTQRAYGPTSAESFRPTAGAGHNHFGLVLVSCEHADLRPRPDGVAIYAEDARTFDPLPAAIVPRAGVVDELRAAALDGVAPLHSGAWGRATLEICLGILGSASQDSEVNLAHQTM